MSTRRQLVAEAGPRQGHRAAQLQFPAPIQRGLPLTKLPLFREALANFAHPAGPARASGHSTCQRAI